MSAVPAQPHAWSVHSSIELSSGTATVCVGGRLGKAGAVDFREALAAALAPGRHLQLDLGGVDYISSAGLAVLQDAAARVHAAGGRLVLTHTSEAVRLALRLAGPIRYLEGVKIENVDGL
jgi:anti-anti-sigma factor